MCPSPVASKHFLLAFVSVCALPLISRGLGPERCVCSVRACAWVWCVGVPLVWCGCQEEAKRAAENDEDTYLQSEWADPRALKSSLLGTKDIRWG